jgi:selenium metabolism protein YedF
MAVTIDARGLACPQPVIMARKAIEENEQNEQITVLVDNDMAVENIRRLAVKMACGFSVTEEEGGIRNVALVRTGAIDETKGGRGPSAREDDLSCAVDAGKKDTGPLVVILSDNRMGRGDDVLGDILIRSFVHTLLQLKPPPDKIICYNSGVKLAVKNSAVLDDLQQLAKDGVDILVCGTCVSYFELGDQIAAGHISNMYDIAETMAGAGRLLRP